MCVLVSETLLAYRNLVGLMRRLTRRKRAVLQHTLQLAELCIIRAHAVEQY